MPLLLSNVCAMGEPGLGAFKKKFLSADLWPMLPQVSVELLLFCTEPGLGDKIFPGLQLRLHILSGRAHHYVPRA